MFAKICSPEGRRRVRSDIWSGARGASSTGGSPLLSAKLTTNLATLLSSCAFSIQSRTKGWSHQQWWETPRASEELNASVRESNLLFGLPRIGRAKDIVIIKLQFQKKKKLSFFHKAVKSHLNFDTGETFLSI